MAGFSEMILSQIEAAAHGKIKQINLFYFFDPKGLMLKIPLNSAFRGIRSLDETRRLDQAETVKVSRVVKQKHKKLGTPPPRPRNPCCPLPYFIKNEP